MKPEKEDPQVPNSAHKDMHKLDAQQLESVQEGVSPVRVLDGASTSRSSSGESWITRSVTPSTSIHSSSPDPTPPRSPEEVTSTVHTWVQGAMPGKRRRIG